MLFPKAFNDLSLILNSFRKVSERPERNQVDPEKAGNPTQAFSIHPRDQI